MNRPNQPGQSLYAFQNQASSNLPFSFAFKPKSGHLSCITHLFTTQLGAPTPTPLPPLSSLFLLLNPIENHAAIACASTIAPPTCTIENPAVKL